MKLSDLLARSRILVPFEGHSMQEGLAALRGALDEAPGGDGRRDPGGFREVSPRSTLLVLAEGERPAAALLAASDPLEDPGGASARLIVALRRGTGPEIPEEAIQRLVLTLKDPEIEAALLTAESPDVVTSIESLMQLPLVRQRTVRDALTPMSYRIYPETPFGEVADLMARKSLSAVPVVGRGLEVIGIITSGDALEKVLESRRGRGPSMSGILARDVMSRAVLCVTEDQDLFDAGLIMAKRQLAQLPVVREGEMVGFLTREAVLGALVSREG